MKAKNYLPRIQNGPVAKRRNRPKTSAVAQAVGVSKSGGGAARSSRSNRGGQSHPGASREADRGARVMWLMIFIGAALAAGFVFAVRSQINAYKLGQAEEELKAALDDYTMQQKYLAVEQQRLLNAGESARLGSEAGLAQLPLNEAPSLHSASVQKVSMTTTQKVAAKAPASGATKATAAKATATKATATKAGARKAPASSAPKAAGRKAPAGQKSVVARKSTQSDPRGQSAKVRRDGDNRRQSPARNQSRR